MFSDGHTQMMSAVYELLIGHKYLSIKRATTVHISGRLYAVRGKMMTSFYRTHHIMISDVRASEYICYFPSVSTSNSTVSKWHLHRSCCCHNV